MDLQRTLQAFEPVEKDHGRIETRKCYQSDDLAWFADKGKCSTPVGTKRIC